MGLGLERTSCLGRDGQRICLAGLALQAMALRGPLSFWLHSTVAFLLITMNGRFHEKGREAYGDASLLQYIIVQPGLVKKGNVCKLGTFDRER